IIRIAMRAIERILDQLNRAYGGEAWHGPALRELLEDVTEEEAKSHPITGIHSMIEIVAHVRATMNMGSERLAGNTPAPDHRGSVAGCEANVVGGCAGGARSRGEPGV